MKSSIFYFDQNSLSCIEKQLSKDHYEYEITIPILPAYAVEFFSIQVGALNYIQNKNDYINNNKVIFNSGYSKQDYGIIVQISYHGIRDYSLLFPWINDNNLKNRLGEFYKEAESSFENGAWLAFALMCGAIFEGLLFAKIGRNDKFCNLIQEASITLIDAQTQDVMNMVRNYRNLVHANKCQTQYITRADAMDIRITLDKLIKKF